jgi:hypothetical protein
MWAEKLICIETLRYGNIEVWGEGGIKEGRYGKTQICWWRLTKNTHRFFCMET